MKFLATFGVTFSGLFPDAFRANKNLCKNSSPKLPRSTQQNWLSFREDVRDDVLRGSPPSIHPFLPNDLPLVTKKDTYMNDTVSTWKMKRIYGSNMKKLARPMRTYHSLYM